METIRIVFYHTKEILKGRGLRVYGLLFCVSMLIMLYTEALQLSMNVESLTYSIASFASSLVNIVINYIVMFIFIKVVRNESFTMEDVRYGLSKSPVFIVMGLLLSLLQIALFFVCSLVGSMYPLYLLLYTIVYTIFVIWNGVVAFGVYDGAPFSELLSSGIWIIKDYIAELLCASICLMIWRMSSQLFVPYLIQLILGTNLYAGLLLPSIIKGYALSISTMLLATLINVAYYAIQYACLLPVYVYLAKLYDDDKQHYVPNAKRFAQLDKKRKR